MPRSLIEVLKEGAARLHEAGIEDSAAEVRRLAALALHCDRAKLLADSQRLLSEAESAALAALVTRRAAREPLARIAGKRGFWKGEFGLNEATLEPRPDSETLIEAALELLSNLPSSSPRTQSAPPSSTVIPVETGIQRAVSTAPINHAAHGGSPLDSRFRGNDNREVKKILDLGTGTGCLLLSLLQEYPAAFGIGADKAPRALVQAKENARALDLAPRCAFVESDWLTAPAIEANGPYDLIVSNPPYIPSNEIASLMPEVRRFDPALALDGGADGLTPYRHLIPLLPGYLKPGGWVLFEVGQGQADAVQEMFRAAGFRDITCRQDLGGVERVITGTKAKTIKQPASNQEDEPIAQA